MKWWRVFVNWIGRFFMMNLPTTQDGKIDAVKILLAVVFVFNGKKVFRITILVNGVPSDHWVEWSQQLENWLMMSGVNVTEDISVKSDFKSKEEKIGNLPKEISNKPKIKIK